MCNHHFEAAHTKGRTEVLVDVLGILVGIGAWITALVILFWVTGTDGILAKLFVSSFAFLISWGPISGGLSPRFAEPGAKEARDAVKVIGFSPEARVVQLEFANASLADTVERMSSSPGQR